MNDGFWYKAWQFAALFGVIVLLGASIYIQGQATSPDEVRAILAEEGVQTGAPGGGGTVAGGWGRDVSIRPELTPVSELQEADASEVHLAWGPDVPPPITRTDQRIWRIHLETIEGVCPLDPGNGINAEMWGFREAGSDEVMCGSPGPILRGRVGDMVEVTLTNMEGNSMPHNIDFHSVTGEGGGAANLTVAPGETATITARLLYPGAFMYHCAFGDVPLHIAKGMYGMFIVDPEEPLHEVDHEWGIVQSEWYVTEPDADGLAAHDQDALFDEEPRFVTFNGRTDGLVGENGLSMNVGERARIYFVNAGINLISSFHPIGSHWDLVYSEGATHAANSVIRGSQTTLIPAGGGSVTELDALVPSTLILVDHALVRTFYKGAIGTIEITGDAQPELFGVPGQEPTTPTEPAPDAGGEGSASNGETLFAQTCAACHGADATGIAGLGSSLVGNEFVAGLGDTELVDFLKVGRPVDHPDNTTGVAMPARGGNPGLTDANLADLAAYLRTLGG